MAETSMGFFQPCIAITDACLDHRNDLNTIAARRGLTVEYEDGFEGPNNEPVWWAIVYGGHIGFFYTNWLISCCSNLVDEVEHGRGRATTRRGAKEAAAGKAVETLNG
jgi:hypothetical protein